MAHASAKALLALDDLEEGHNDVTVELSAEELELEDEFFVFRSMVTAAVAVRRSMDNFNLDGVVRCQISGDCYRCLKPADQVVEAVHPRVTTLLGAVLDDDLVLFPGRGCDRAFVDLSLIHI